MSRALLSVDYRFTKGWSDCTKHRLQSKGSQSRAVTTTISRPLVATGEFGGSVS